MVKVGVTLGRAHLRTQEREEGHAGRVGWSRKENGKKNGRVFLHRHNQRTRRIYAHTINGEEWIYVCAHIGEGQVRGNDGGDV